MTKKYILRTQEPDKLNASFYEQYDSEFLYTKADTFWFITRHRNEFKAFITAAGGSVEDLTDKYYYSIEAENHFTCLHHCEVLFALIFAAFQPLPHWIYLTTYDTRQIKKKVQMYLDCDFKGLSGRDDMDLQRFLSWSVYSGVRPKQDPPEKTWEQALDNLDFILRNLGQKYLDGAEYNAYKHGARMLRGHFSVKFHPPNMPDKPDLLLESPNALTFLEIADQGEGGLTVTQTTRFFNPEEDMAQLQLMAGIMKTLRTVRLAKYAKQQSGPIVVYYDLDRDHMTRLTEITEWKMTI